MTKTDYQYIYDAEVAEINARYKTATLTPAQAKQAIREGKHPADILKEAQNAELAAAKARYDAGLAGLKEQEDKDTADETAGKDELKAAQDEMAALKLGDFNYTGMTPEQAAYLKALTSNVTQEQGEAKDSLMNMIGAAGNLNTGGAIKSLTDQQNKYLNTLNATTLGYGQQAEADTYNKWLTGEQSRLNSQGTAIQNKMSTASQELQNQWSGQQNRYAQESQAYQNELNRRMQQSQFEQEQALRKQQYEDSQPKWYDYLFGGLTAAGSLLGGIGSLGKKTNTYNYYTPWG